MKIMIVDNDFKTRKLIKRIILHQLSKLITIYECENGLDAINSYKKENPDWVLMDIEIEPVNGLTASDIIMESNPDAKIMIVTKNNDPEYQAVAKSYGVCDYVLKDNLFNIPEIIKTNSKWYN